MTQAFGRSRFKAEFRSSSAAERDAVSAQRTQLRQPRRHVLVDGTTTFTAFSAHDLLDMDSHAKYGRPGMPY